MTSDNKIYGLVACGGQSSRMGTDKSLLNYHGKPQRYYLYDVLSTLCERIFISCNDQQAKEIPAEYDVIIDSEKYQQIGPMGGLLSAFEKYPGASFLVIGCDYPFIQKSDLARLLEANNDSLAITYYNDYEQIREPLIGFYKSGCYDLLKKQFEQDDYSLNHFLKEINASTIIPASPKTIQSVDTHEGYQKAFHEINQQKSLKFEP